MRFAQLLAALLGLQAVHSCSDFLLNATFDGSGCISGRTMDFEVDLGHEVGYVSNGTTLTLLPICRTSPGKVTTKHAFAFLASTRKLFQNISWVRIQSYDPVSSACYVVVFRNHFPLRSSYPSRIST